MAKGHTISTYEDARNQRLEENRKKFEDLGILTASKSFTALHTSGKKIQHHLLKLRSKTDPVSEPRRSSRVRNTVVSYSDDVNIALPKLTKRSKPGSGSYLARPASEVKVATDEERSCAFEAAEALQRTLKSGHPSFVKSMVRSHVYSCFWLGLPTKFCEDYLPNKAWNMTLEDENGTEYDAVFLGNRTGLSGGWRAFALDHKLDDGDALVFELIDPARFKIYIVKAVPNSAHHGDILKKDICAGKVDAKLGSQATLTRKSKRLCTPKRSSDSESTEKQPMENAAQDEVKSIKKKPVSKSTLVSRKTKKGERSTSMVKDELEEDIVKSAVHHNPTSESKLPDIEEMNEEPDEDVDHEESADDVNEVRSKEPRTKADENKDKEDINHKKQKEDKLPDNTEIKNKDNSKSVNRKKRVASKLFRRRW